MGKERKRKPRGEESAEPELLESERSSGWHIIRQVRGTAFDMLLQEALGWPWEWVM